MLTLITTFEDFGKRNGPRSVDDLLRCLGDKSGHGMSGEDSEFDFDTPGETPVAAMDPQATENLLKSIFHHYAVEGNNGAIITGARFFKFVRECGLMNFHVTQVLTAGVR